MRRDSHLLRGKHSVKLLFPLPSVSGIIECPQDFVFAMNDEKRMMLTEVFSDLTTDTILEFTPDTEVYVYHYHPEIPGSLELYENQKEEVRQFFEKLVRYFKKYEF